MGGNGSSEVAITWRDADTGLDLRARLDRLLVRRGSLVVDLKSTDDPNPEGFARSMYRFGYHRQAAFYCAAAQALHGTLPRFVFVAVRNEPPHEIAVYELEPEALAIGQHEIRESLDELSRAIRTNDWQAPWEGPAWESGQPPKINLPQWALKQGERALAIKEVA
ncbi:PD-(D/E)XK nuclease-like domain-containing protein [Nannocystis pusilla]|uniref:PD-(D/E)XK nuclease-like domain-containing protein n=1 Tax=Nannocystis pusilla TaxID=889268 RepID=A0A9X3EIU2_9BACT|nr:PD-(D/E)XK nuclease-like domain-containing protein [Nannocystis pusilla]